MTKKDFIGKYAEKNEITKVAAKEIIEGVFGLIEEVLSEGEDIKLTGFGDFVVKEMAERKGRNPKTGEEITIEAKKAVKFKVSKGLKEKVN